MEALNLSEIHDELEVIFFDAAGTLFEVRGSVGEIYHKFARRYGIEVEPELIQQAFSREFRHQPPLAFPPDTSEPDLYRLEFEWWKMLVRKVFTGHNFPRFDDFFAEVFEFFRGPDAWQLFDDVIPVLTALKKSGRRLAIISNFDSRLIEVLDQLGIDRFFDGVHLSSRIGSAKPDRRIFLEALRIHGIEPGQALHLGDSLREDVEGASAAGLRAVWLDRGGSFPDNPPAIRITRLEQLINP